MKHRKFVKQLMSTGCPRDLANLMAHICRSRREPYAHGWERYKKIMGRNLWFFEFLGGARK